MNSCDVKAICGTNLCWKYSWPWHPYMLLFNKFNLLTLEREDAVMVMGMGSERHLHLHRLNIQDVLTSSSTTTIVTVTVTVTVTVCEQFVTWMPHVISNFSSNGAWQKQIQKDNSNINIPCVIFVIGFYDEVFVSSSGRFDLTRLDFSGCSRLILKKWGREGG